MPRPLPVNPRGPRRRSHHRPTYALTCPKTSPLFALNALHALTKPNPWTKSKIAHVDGHQPWPPQAQAALTQTLQDIQHRLHFSPQLHQPDEGDVWFLLPIPHQNLDEAKALALLLSKRLPQHYFTLGRLLIHNNQFLRRQYGYKLKLTIATNIHLPRPIRSTLRDLL